MAHKHEKEKEAQAEAASKAAPTAAAVEADPPVEEQVRKLTVEKDELLNTLVRRQADFDNYRKRNERERSQERVRGTEQALQALLPVLDAFDNALTAAQGTGDSEFLKGFELIRRQLWDALSKQGLVRIESVGKEFNPHFHHAIARVETLDHAEGTVVNELQPGYSFQERVLRPAMVRVAAAPSPSKQEN